MPPLLLNLVTGLLGQMRDMEVASRNLTNLRTPGYRKERVTFHDLLYQETRTGRDRAAAEGPPGIGVGADTRGPELVHRQGQLEGTDRELDLAIQGEGFFQLALPEGDIIYSRFGGLGLDAERRLVNADGLPVFPEVRLPQGFDEWQVQPDGRIVGRSPEGEEQEAEGAIVLARFANPAALDRFGILSFTPTERSGEPIEGAPGEQGFGELAQRHIEASNVDVSEEMVSLLQAQRTYQVNLRALQALDESLALANNIRRG